MKENFAEEEKERTTTTNYSVHEPTMWIDEERLTYVLPDSK